MSDFTQEQIDRLELLKYQAFVTAYFVYAEEQPRHPADEADWHQDLDDAEWIDRPAEEIASDVAELLELLFAKLSNSNLSTLEINMLLRLERGL